MFFEPRTQVSPWLPNGQNLHNRSPEFSARRTECLWCDTQPFTRSLPRDGRATKCQGRSFCVGLDPGAMPARARRFSRAGTRG
jgi:hypothetical protein